MGFLFKESMIADPIIPYLANKIAKVIYIGFLFLIHFENILISAVPKQKPNFFSEILALSESMI
jgi:hypothetical protein